MQLRLPATRPRLWLIMLNLFQHLIIGLLLISLLAHRYSLAAKYAWAQELGLGVATRVVLLDKDAPDAAIVSWSSGGYRLSNTAYDQALYGVVVENPALALEDLSLNNAKMVLTQGKTLVRVVSKNGAIREGDYVTSSSLAGVGQKAERNGYVVGLALEDYTASDPNQVGRILVAVNPRSTIVGTSLKTNLFDVLRLGVAAPFEAPLNALRYLLASVFMIISFILGFIFFGRVVARGTEAFGRNPLAGNLIGMSIIFNLIMTFLIMAFGLGLAYLILQL